MAAREITKTVPGKSNVKDEKLQELRILIQEGIDSGVSKKSFSEILKGVKESHNLI